MPPVELCGQGTAEHELAKKGLLVMAVTDPEYPALQEHPLATLFLAELAEQETAEQEPV